MAKKAKVLTQSDIKLVMAVAGNPRNQTIFMLTVLAGLRACEVAGLTIGSVLGANGAIKDTITLDKTMTKGNKSRQVPVSKKLSKVLADYIKTLPAKRLNLDNPLFVSQVGRKAFTPHGIVMLLQRLYRSAKIDGASSHSGRRTFCTSLADKGISVFVLQQLMGHSDIATTSGYVYTGQHQQVQAVNLL